MTQQTSPFVEGKYGWSYGEDGWNVGADENWLKYGYLLDNNVNGVVSALPTLVNGESYFLTADSRFYFAVGGNWYSSPCPKWFIFKIKDSGDFWWYDGVSAVAISNPQQLSDAITTIQSSLGTAAYVNIEDLATQAELDIASAQAAAYTDTLRSDLSADTGSSLVGFKQAAAGAVPRTMLDKGREVVSVKDFGAVGDGVTDDTSAFTAASNYESRVSIPSGSYLLSSNISGHWSVDAGVTFGGAGRVLERERGFWTDFSVDGANIWRFRDRVLIGDACDQSGKRNIGSDKSWVGFEANGYLTYFDTSSQAQVAQTIGRIGLSSASRTSDQVDTISSCIGIASYVNNDRNDATAKGAWAYYGHAANKGNTSSTFVAEMCVCNVSSNPLSTSSPYNIAPKGVTANLWLTTGGETVQGGTPATAYTSMAIGIASNAPADLFSKYDKGIVFQSTSIHKDRGFAVAIEMGINQRIQWVYDGSGIVGGYWDSENNTAAVSPGGVFVADGIEFRRKNNTGSTAVHRLTIGASDDNGISLVGAATGATPSVIARGSDGDISLNIRPKGTGTVRLQGADTSRKIEVGNSGIGFYGATPSAKPYVSGSRGGNAALGDLLEKLATLGLITNNTTA